MQWDETTTQQQQQQQERNGGNHETVYKVNQIIIQSDRVSDFRLSAFRI